jgi:rhodanese-related sulfurtransferase
MKLKASIFFVALAFSLVLAWHFGLARDAMWQIVKYQIRSEFPTIEHLTIDKLRELPPESYLLFDARTPAEYSISHLKGAINSNSPDEILGWLSRRNLNTAIVYCSVGYRSAELAQKTNQLIAARDLLSESLKIYNLEGSIFEWANRNYPTYRNGEEYLVVHPYNLLWSHLLEDSVQQSKLP